jgi:DNA replication protein DnaC
MPEKEPKTETTLGGLARLEEGICDFLKRFEEGGLDPWKKLLSDAGRDLNLKSLALSLGPRYWRCTLENFHVYNPEKQSPILKKAKEFAADMPRRVRCGGLFLIGNAGTGKDHVVAALLKIAVAKYRFSARWWDGGNLFDAVANSISEESFARLKKELAEPHILAISDPVPPRGHLNDSQLRRLRDAIDKRYRDTKSTWVTTNVDNNRDAEELLTRPLLERLKEGSLQLFFDWNTYRERVRCE